MQKDLKLAHQHKKEISINSIFPWYYELYDYCMISEQLSDAHIYTLQIGYFITSPILRKRCSLKCLKIRRKATLSESRF